MKLLTAFNPDLALRIGSPERKPSIEMLWLEAKAEMAAHATPIKNRASGVIGPEVDNGLQVGIPVVDMRSEDGPKQIVLAGAVVEAGEQLFQSGVSADAIVERGWIRLHEGEILGPMNSRCQPQVGEVQPPAETVSCTRWADASPPASRAPAAAAAATSSRMRTGW